uniref:hypothetical protein n=1 Tax=Flavobacterium sp. TaxID=239 RepID=UPI00404AD2EE
MKRFILLFFSIITLFVSAQNNKNAILIDSISINATEYLGKDNFDHLYYLKINELFKKNSEKEFNYKNVSLGKLAQVSFENSLQPLLLYADFNTVVVLDNFLNEVQRIDFNTISPFLKVSYIGFGGQNKIWFFDSMTQRFGVYNSINSSIVFISNPQKNEIKKIYSNYNFFYYVDADKNYYKISIFGKIKFLGKLPLNDSMCFLDASKIIYRLGNSLNILNLEDNTTSEIIINKKSFTNFFFKDGILSIFTPNKIINYQINLP